MFARWSANKRLQKLYNHNIFIFIRRDDFCVWPLQCWPVVKMNAETPETESEYVIKLPPLKLIYCITFSDNISSRWTEIGICIEQDVEIKEVSVKNDSLKIPFEYWI